MSAVLDWIFEGVANWLAGIVTDIMDVISAIFLEALGTDMTAMEEYFPFVTAAFSIIQYTAWALLFIITVWQLFRVFGGPITDAENPWRLLARSIIFAILIGYAKPVFGIVLDIAKAPYTALMDASMNPGDFTFAGIENVVSAGLVTLVSTVSIVGLLLQVIFMIALGWNYFKLLLEVVERYIVVGVLCYTSPLAFAMGASNATYKVFGSWCHMTGSQLLLLVLNVWFLRAFNSSAGHFIANGGALTSGRGNIFLWLFCALAFLKTAQKFDAYLASLGLSVAQTGGGMGMEMLVGFRLLAGMGGNIRSAGSLFKDGNTESAGNAASAGFMPEFTSRFKSNSYIRDAVTNGGTHMGAGGSIGFVGRAFGGMAARNGAELTGGSISSVASRPAAVSGSIVGEIADRSLKNYMPHISNTPALADAKLSDTSITGGHIRTSVAAANGKNAGVDLYSMSGFDRPDTPHSVVTASDGSKWYQVASGNGMGMFYNTPQFIGDACESEQIAEAFPGIANDTSLRTVDDGVIEATHPDGGGSLWLNSAYYHEPDAPHDNITDSSGVGWYAMHPHASIPEFEAMPAHSDLSAGLSEAAADYNGAQFRQFMPGYDTAVSQVDASRNAEGIIEIRHPDGSATGFYDKTQYRAPHGDYTVCEDSRGNRWYAVSGTPIVEHRPVFENGKPVFDGTKMRTVNAESVRYKSTPTAFDEPKKRDTHDRKPPNPKKR